MKSGKTIFVLTGMMLLGASSLALSSVESLKERLLSSSFGAISQIGAICFDETETKLVGGGFDTTTNQGEFAIQGATQDDEFEVKSITLPKNDPYVQNDKVIFSIVPTGAAAGTLTKNIEIVIQNNEGADQGFQVYSATTKTEVDGVATDLECLVLSK